MEKCEILLEYGADVRLGDDQKCSTALHYAVLYQNYGIFRVLESHNLAWGSCVKKQGCNRVRGESPYCTLQLRRDRRTCVAT